jgi:predicted porin
MKKNLIALAVLAASGVASAQSSLTIYGIADVWFGSTNTETNVGNVAVGSRQTAIGSGGVSTSRFGFKGTEDLGGGFKANFVLEQGFNIDNGTQATAGQAFARQSYVGFSTPYGEVRLGKTFTPFDDISGATAPGFDSALSPYVGVWKSTGYAANPANTIYYASPTFSGVSAAASYSLGENKNTVLNANGVLSNKATGVGSFDIKYEGGPVFVGFAYQAQKLAPTVNGLTEKFIRLNGSYDLGVVKLLAGFGRANDLGSVKDASTKEWQLGVDFPVNSALTLSGGFAGSKDNFASATNEAKRTGFGLAANYALSKRTSVYGGARFVKTTDNLAATPDLKSDLYAVGIRHTF